MINTNDADLKESIPKGPYCYSGTRCPDDPNYKVCTYWKWLGEGRARCIYLDIEDGKEDIHGDEPLALWDQLKECGINDVEELHT